MFSYHKTAVQLTLLSVCYGDIQFCLASPLFLVSNPFYFIPVLPIVTLDRCLKQGYTLSQTGTQTAVNTMDVYTTL